MRNLAIIFIIAGAALLIAGCTYTFGNSVEAPTVEPTRELPQQAAMIATINAAPPLPVVAVPVAEVAAVTTTSAYDPALVATGQETYASVCAACHGVDARGVVGLGKDLLNSDFIRGLNDADLVTFVKTGRPIWDAQNTTGIDMPPKGGNPALSDDQIMAVVAYLRANDINGAALPAMQEPNSAYDPALVAQGEQVFASICAACHGLNALGVAGLGKDLVHSEFTAGLADADLLNFIKTGRPIWDAQNTTGVDMPPKGGNPALTDDEIMAIIAYLRTLAGG